MYNGIKLAKTHWLQVSVQIFKVSKFIFLTLSLVHHGPVFSQVLFKWYYEMREGGKKDVKQEYKTQRCMEYNKVWDLPKNIGFSLLEFQIYSLRTLFPNKHYMRPYSVSCSSGSGITWQMVLSSLLKIRKLSHWNSSLYYSSGYAQYFIIFNIHHVVLGIGVLHVLFPVVCHVHLKVQITSGSLIPETLLSIKPLHLCVFGELNFRKP